ncbi:MAG: hypothetical protein K2N03_08985 [Muribaculaceae bacterium]|nr:hypothetical protein [Muribaculaceae bacterium]
MDSKELNKIVPESITEQENNEFKGYSLEDLRYRRALIALQKEFAKSKITSSVSNLQSLSPFSKNFGKGKSKVGKVGAIAGKLVSGFNYLDYAMIGYNLFTSFRKILSLFKKKKNE